MARTERLTRYLMPATVVAAVAVLVLTGYAMLSGDGSTPDSGKPGTSTSVLASPSASYAPPPDWTEPARWANLPRGARTDERGMEIAFPHTADGAVAMMVESNSTVLEGARGNVQAQLKLFDSYLVAADRTAENREIAELAALDADKQLHKSMGLPAGSDLPPGAYVRTTVIGFKIVSQSPDEASAWLLSRVTMKTGETQAETGSYMRSLVAVRWEGDWKSSTAAYTRALALDVERPEIVAPGDPAFNQSAWTAIREAS